MQQPVRDIPLHWAKYYIKGVFLRAQYFCSRQSLVVSFMPQ